MDVFQTTPYVEFSKKTKTFRKINVMDDFQNKWF